MTDFDVTRATAIISRAIEHGVMSAMPQSDTDRIVEAEKVVELARQVEAVKEAWMAQGGETAVKQHLPGWTGAEAILIEANVFVGSNPNGSTTELPSAPPLSGEERPMPGQATSAPSPGTAPTLPGAPSRSDGESSGQADSTESAPASPPPAPSTSSQGDPAKDEVWADLQGVEWLVTAPYTGGPMIEVMKVETGEVTVAPAGMLKRRVRGAEHDNPQPMAPPPERSRRIIDSFSGPYEFLSNFSPSPIEIAGVVYPTVEHAFQAWKTLDPALHKRIAALPTPGEAKKVGREVVLREGWDEGLRVDVMRGCLELKFAANSDLAYRLLNTGDASLVEGNTWGDTYWGVCGGVGENMLGRLLEERREQLKGDQPEVETDPVPEEEPTEPEVVITPDPGRPDHPEEPEPDPPSVALQEDYERDQQEAGGSRLDSIDIDKPDATWSPDSVTTLSTTAYDADASPRDIVLEHDDEGDDDYQIMLEETKERYTPSGMPIPLDLADPPEIDPAVFDELPDREARAMHAQFNALAARAKYLHDVEDARARECGLLRKLYMRGAMRAAREKLGSKATEAHIKEEAEESDENVAKWGDRADKHAGQAAAYKTFFEIYTQHVVVLSRDWTMREKQLQS